MVLIEKAVFGMAENEVNDFLMKANCSGECTGDSCKTADWNCDADT